MGIEERHRGFSLRRTAFEGNRRSRSRGLFEHVKVLSGDVRRAREKS